MKWDIMKNAKQLKDAREDEFKKAVVMARYNKERK